MPVETGMIPDDDAEDVLAGAAQAGASSGPPPEVASVEVLAAEVAAVDGAPTVTVRDRVFRLRSKVPGMLLMQLSKAQTDLAAPGALQDSGKQAAALAKTSDAITKLVVGEERSDFIEWCEDAEPPMEMPELMSLVGEMMVAITGRPT